MSMSEDTIVKELVDSDEDEDQRTREDGDSMELPTSVTIVEADGSTSVVEDAAVSSILTDAGPNSSIQFGHTQGGGLTYRVVGLEDSAPFTAQASSGVQLLSSPINGQYYVIGPSQDVIGRQRNPPILDTRSLTRVSSKAIVRDEKKRATHNEVERRRRDKINGWINKLAKIVPTCTEDSNNAKIGQVLQDSSKGGILAKACEYINELRNTNIRLAATLKEHENATEEVSALRRENMELRRENLELKRELGHTDEENTVIITTSNVLRSH